MEVKEGTQGRNLQAWTEVESIEECCLLDYPLFEAYSVFFPRHSTIHSEPNPSTSTVNQNNALQANLREAFSQVRVSLPKQL